MYAEVNAPRGNMIKAGVQFENRITLHRIGLQSLDTNFDAILINWDQPDPVTRLQVRAEKGDVLLQQRVSRSQLRQ